jgi:hypothetical protein
MIWWWWWMICIKHNFEILGCYSCGETNWPRPRNGPGPASPTRPKRYTPKRHKTLIGGTNLSDVVFDDSGPSTASPWAVRCTTPPRTLTPRPSRSPVYKYPPLLSSLPKIPQQDHGHAAGIALTKPAASASRACTQSTPPPPPFDSSSHAAPRRRFRHCREASQRQERPIPTRPH